MGIALATCVIAGEELRTGQLTQVLEPYRLDPAEVYVVFPERPRPSAEVRPIVDHLGMPLDRV